MLDDTLSIRHIIQHGNNEKNNIRQNKSNINGYRYLGSSPNKRELLIQYQKKAFNRKIIEMTLSQ